MATPIVGTPEVQEEVISAEILSILTAIGISIKLSDFTVTEVGGTNPSDVISLNDAFKLSATVTFSAPAGPSTTIMNLILNFAELDISFYAESYGPAPELKLGTQVLATTAGTSSYVVELMVNPNPLQTEDVYKLAAAVRFRLIPALPPVLAKQPVAHGFLEGLAVEAYDPNAI